MVSDITVLTPNPEMNADIAMMYVPTEMFEDNPVVLPYSFVSNNRYIGGFVGKLSETAINIPWLFFDVGCGLQVSVIEGVPDNQFFENVNEIQLQNYQSLEIEGLLGEELMNFDESPYVVNGYEASPSPHGYSPMNLLDTVSTYAYSGNINTTNLYALDYPIFSNYIPDYNLVSTISSFTSTPHFAVAFHVPCPITSKVLYYYAEKYADEGNYVRDPEAIQEMIRAAKLCARYAKEARDYYTSRLADYGYNVVMSFDAPHMYLDDDNIFHWEAQPAKEDEVSIRIYGSQIYLFNGLGNEEWKNSVPGSTIFDKSPYYTFNLIDYVNAVSPSAELITNFTLE